MFAGYDGSENTEVYEDELYPEESSSEQSVDSEVEFHLYSQIHYSQDLGEISTLEMDEEAGVAEVMGHSSGLTEKQDEDEKLTEFTGGGTQLSDEPEIIVLSDTPDEDSIYKSKAKRSRCSSTQGKTHIHMVSSTPNHTKAAGCNVLCPPESDVGTPRQRNSTSGRPTPVCSAGPQAIHDVLVIDNSSEEESLISDSDNVESWMLLGAGADDKDGDIMLNLEGCATPVSEGEIDVDWSISHKDLEARISNYTGMRHSSMRYYKNVTCRNCDRPGHLSKNCPTPKKVPPCCLCAGRDHLQHSCPARFCLNCCLPGHYFRECLERAYWNKHCNRCDMKGHYADACPEIWRQYHLTTKPGPIKAAGSQSERSVAVYCYNCSRKGHFGYECSEKRMQGNMFPSSPFVYYYDDECDIKRRANRLKRKVADLQEAGLLPEQSETPLQEEQPEVHSHKKKSKLWKEQRGKNSKNSEQQKKMKVSRAKKPQEEKHRRGVEILCEPKEDFPRGYKQQVCKGSRVRHKSLFQAFSGSKAMCVQQPLEGAKRKKKWKKQKNASPDSRDNLFLIKQRKKKSKQKSW
ncbi:zinc finger CCHC domain-containing protein 7 isoform X1 [Corvus cornix cornix]|uniref:zinc finger CCHC domain-containing protein 7 isoform X1 n=1 Tax=Corvus cornix cornix TaxID=932674 RepID=UPI000534367F|nr:zinc finger CCHC domain-containing protein 7 isoform X1 [Corvus cornix cornix]XP_039423308.1 zinc finger CCHC domain-containing protein 7 isoform X1 [Corvus cornix cornix]XP_039423309.1 zinc finger CCHC domain-containing protein 7 isoform X1 [Corvus cornix cornix]XP_039423310.1 zinc finger CCHC domain-containing protein 7 isoform X1 [Corvus cornix cornix]